MADLDVAFPVLSPADIAALTARGKPREMHAGDTLFSEGDRNRSFFVVLDGAVEILETLPGYTRGKSRCIARASSPAISTCSTVAPRWSPDEPSRMAAWSS